MTDQGALRLRFQDIFTPAIRDAVLNERPSTIECNWLGIRYGSGAVWVKPQIDGRATKAEATSTRYLVETINLPSVYDSVKNQPTVTVELACQTDQQWVVVDDGANGKLRYRAWNKPHTLADKPDLIIAPGRKESQGAGPCSHSAWLFNAGQTELFVEGRGCNSDRIPEGAQAKVQTSTGGNAAAPLWCF